LWAHRKRYRKSDAVEDYKQKILRRKLKIDRTQVVGRRSASNFNDVDARSSSSAMFAWPRLIARNPFSRYVERPAKLFDEGLSRSQIGKAPTIINLPFPHDRTSMSRLNMLRLVKMHEAAAQCDIQSFGRDGKLDDIWIFSLTRQPSPVRSC
jgi:hypothetical protein